VLQLAQQVAQHPAQHLAQHLQQPIRLRLVVVLGIVQNIQFAMPHYFLIVIIETGVPMDSRTPST
jgi:exonuclease V gamma subunit